MALKRGFDAVVKMKVGGAWKTLATIGDITYGSNKTDIAVKTRASTLVRTIPGMESMPITMTVLDGTDPKDTGNFNGYAALKNAYDNDTPVELMILPTANSQAAAAEVDEVFSVLGFETNSPVDDLKTANVTLAPTALDVATGGSSNSGSGPASTSGEEGGEEGGEGGEEGGGGTP